MRPIKNSIPTMKDVKRIRKAVPGMNPALRMKYEVQRAKQIERRNIMDLSNHFLNAEHIKTCPGCGHIAQRAAKNEIFMPAFNVLAQWAMLCKRSQVLQTQETDKLNKAMLELCKAMGMAPEKFH